MLQEVHRRRFEHEDRMRTLKLLSMRLAAFFTLALLAGLIILVPLVAFVPGFPDYLASILGFCPTLTTVLLLTIAVCFAAATVGFKYIAMEISHGPDNTRQDRSFFLASEGLIADALSLAQGGVGTNKNHPFYSDVTEEGFVAHELREVGVRLFRDQKYTAALEFFLLAGEKLNARSPRTDLIDYDIERARNWADTGNCLASLEQYEVAFGPLENSLAIIENLSDDLTCGTLSELLDILAMIDSLASAQGRDDLTDRQRPVRERLQRLLDEGLERLAERRAQGIIADHWFRWPGVQSTVTRG